jgi:hypothetical protein
MGQLTKEQAAQLKQLQELADAPDDQTEVWVRDAKGRETRLTGAHAQKWIGQLFGDDAPPNGGKTRKAAPAKKATAGAGDDEDQGDDDEDQGDDDEEPDPAPATRPHWYFGS